MELPDATAQARPPRWFATLRLAVLAAATVPILVVHYMTPATAEHGAMHDLHRHLLYIPIVLAAFWFGWRGGLAAAVLISAAFFPHLLSMMQVQHTHAAMEHAGAWPGPLNRALELLIYLVIGGGAGVLIDRLRAEQNRLRRAMNELTRRTREVFEAEEQLRRADRLSAIGQLTAGLAHEIRNPLASIRGAAEILGDGDTPAPRRAEFSQILREETQRLDRVLGSFLDYARSQKATNGAAPPSADLLAVIEKMRPLLGHPLADARVDLVLDVAAELGHVAIAADLLHQALLNLALNAIQAMSGGGKLTITARRCSSPSVSEGPHCAVIRVCDTGPGVLAALAGRIFDPFFTTKPHGLGLGLAIVDKIITGSGGRIELEAVPSGACFRITLPLA